MDREQRGQLIQRVSKNTILVNTILFLFKLFAGIFGRSAAMISDAVHSMSDVFSTIIVLFGAKMSQKDADDDHNYGHEKMESVASLLLAVVLGFTAFEIMKSGVESIIAFAGGAVLPRPSLLPIVAAILSILVKEWMYHYTKRAAIKTNSTGMLADAWHHRSDAFSSLGSLLGILGAYFGFAILDPIASMVIGLLIFKVCYDIIITVIDQITDKAVDPETYEHIKALVENTEGVLHLDSIHTRYHVTQLYIDARISVEGALTVNEGHAIAQEINHKIHEAYPTVKSCLIHVNPH